MGMFRGETPKRHRLWSNCPVLINQVLERAGCMTEGKMGTFTKTLCTKYIDRNGVQRRVGKKKELKESQSSSGSQEVGHPE